ncbi:hypothetical protein [Spirosoma endophyticum]|uniref:Uncharacterized protein n=1 Tax=Spirosoma endophyticum TaxID=662367 RepID=A0A1I1H6R3_9BACT|nr:hypothetical protein [Spirosoma endophyticum]SFC19262.1 hypothetical protein SAMN05216167_101631 [Spirosoma endophyticum]
MEFDEIQKIWDSQTHEPLWSINETALHKRILVKKEKVSHIANFSELLLLVVNIGAGSLTLGLNYFKPPTNLSLYLMSAWMLGTALYVLVSRIRRLKSSDTFDRSLLGELKQAMSMATYQVRLSQLMRWNIVPIGFLSLLGFWESGQSIWLSLGLLIFFGMTYFAGGWEHRIYQAKKRELEALLTKLEQK